MDGAHIDPCTHTRVRAIEPDSSYERPRPNGMRRTKSKKRHSDGQHMPIDGEYFRIRDGSKQWIARRCVLTLGYRCASCSSLHSCDGISNELLSVGGRCQRLLPTDARWWFIAKLAPRPLALGLFFTGGPGAAATVTGGAAPGSLPITARRPRAPSLTTAIPFPFSA